VRDSRLLRKRRKTAPKKFDHPGPVEWLHFFTVAGKMCQVPRFPGLPWFTSQFFLDMPPDVGVIEWTSPKEWTNRMFGRRKKSNPKVSQILSASSLMQSHVISCRSRPLSRRVGLPGVSQGCLVTPVHP